MSTRYLIAALLMTSACVAQADVLPSSAQSSFLSGWTTGNGSDVVASGVLSNNVSLIGGVAYGSDANLAQTLYQNASAAAGTAGGEVKITYSQGIQGTYLLGTGHGLMAAMLGNSMSVVGSSNGVVVSTASPQVSAANGAVDASMYAASTAGTSGGSGANNSAGSSSSTTMMPTTMPMVTGTTLNTAQGATNGAGSQVGPAAVNVPEPSSLALLAVGLFGAAGLRRRRNR